MLMLFRSIDLDGNWNGMHAVLVAIQHAGKTAKDDKNI